MLEEKQLERDMAETLSARTPKPWNEITPATVAPLQTASVTPTRNVRRAPRSSSKEPAPCAAGVLCALRNPRARCLKTAAQRGERARFKSRVGSNIRKWKEQQDQEFLYLAYVKLSVGITFTGRYTAVKILTCYVGHCNTWIVQLACKCIDVC